MITKKRKRHGGKEEEEARDSELEPQIYVARLIRERS
jgi:hypothetical protein